MPGITSTRKPARPRSATRPAPSNKKKRLARDRSLGPTHLTNSRPGSRPNPAWPPIPLDCAASAGRLLKVIVLGNLVTLRLQVHTRFTYHRTWETGLEVAARAAITNPDFYWVNSGQWSAPVESLPNELLRSAFGLVCSLLAAHSSQLAPPLAPAGCFVARSECSQSAFEGLIHARSEPQSRRSFRPLQPHCQRDYRAPGERCAGVYQVFE